MLLHIKTDVKNKRNISVQTVFFIHTKSKEEMDYHVAKKHAQTSAKQSKICPSCEQEYPNYYSLQQHRRNERGTKQRKPSDTVADLTKVVAEEGEDGEKLKEEFSDCQHFLVDTEIEKARHEVFNFQISKLDTKIINEKLEEVINKLHSAQAQHCSGFCSSKN